MSELKKNSYFIELNGGDTLHVRHLSTDDSKHVVVMLHGSFENGKIFYSNSDKGLAPFTAKEGYHVYVPDLRGKGKSRPKISKKSCFGQTEHITEDIPAIMDFVESRHPDKKIHWVTHSWGGILLSSSIACNPQLAKKISSLAYFGCKRGIYARNYQQFIIVDIIWGIFVRALTKMYGYVPVRRVGLGSDNETKMMERQTFNWVKANPWVDTNNGFDYHQALQSIQLPPTLYLTGVKDLVYGNPIDVKRFIEESGPHESEFMVLSKENGNLHDYGHIDILTHPDALQDHFKVMIDWVKKHET